MAGRISRQKASELQKLWAKLYVKHNFNATKAAREAGYSDGPNRDGCQRRGYENSHNTLVLIEVARLVEERNKRLQIDADFVLTRALEFDSLDIADIMDDENGILPIKEWPKSWRTSISGMDFGEIVAARNDPTRLIQLLKKVKLPDKQKNLELIGKHIDVRAWEKEAGLTVSANNIMLVPSATSVDDWEKAAQEQQEKALNNV